jgi:hypothetical protein
VRACVRACGQVARSPIFVSGCGGVAEGRPGADVDGASPAPLQMQKLNQGEMAMPDRPKRRLPQPGSSAEDRRRLCWAQPERGFVERGTVLHKANPVAVCADMPLRLRRYRHLPAVRRAATPVLTKGDERRPMNSHSAWTSRRGVKAGEPVRPRAARSNADCAVGFQARTLAFLVREHEDGLCRRITPNNECEKRCSRKRQHERENPLRPTESVKRRRPGHRRRQSEATQGIASQ